MALCTRVLVLACLAVPAVSTANEVHLDDLQSSQIDLADRPRTTWVWVDPQTHLAPDALETSHISHILYVNRCAGGCTITPGLNDSRANTSSIVGSTATLSEFPHSQEIWDQTVACIREVYSPYDVEVVTEDPGTDVFHHEAMLAGSPGELGLDSNIGGIAPSNCDPLNNVISFSFANGPLGGDVTEMCWTVAQESAHSFGLPNHVFNCLDPMTYIPNCGRKYFRNQAFPCGEDMVRPCNCTGSAQNSHVELTAVFGEGTPPPPPEVTIQYPEDGATVENKFTMFFQAQDPRLVARTEIWVNGTKYGEIAGKGYDNRFDDYQSAMPDLPNGYLDVELRSMNDLEMSYGSAKATYLKGSPCENADQCWDFQDCNEGRCTFPPATAAPGDACDVDQQCVEGSCADVDGEKACAIGCNPTVSGACHEGFECLGAAGGDSVCWVASEEGGCCSVAGSKRDPVPVVASLFFFGLLLLLRRRRA